MNRGAVQRGFIWLLLWLLPILATAQPVAPDVLVRATVTDVLQVIRQSSDARVVQETVERKVLPHFDFRAMTQLAMGKFWRDASPAQQARLETAFRELLVRTYTAALSDASRVERTVEVRPLSLKPGETETLVRTQVKEPGRPPLAIDYRMTVSAAGWKVTEIVAEGASLVISYRSSFGTEISRSGIDGLIRLLEDKNRQAAKA